LPAYLYVQRQTGDRSARTVEVTPDVLADYAADGRLIGVEFIAPEHLTREVIADIVRRLDLPAGSTDELAPLVRHAA